MEITKRFFAAIAIVAFTFSMVAQQTTNDYFEFEQTVKIEKKKIKVGSQG